MYEELVKRLRERAAWINFPHHGEEYPIEDAKLIMDAADAIEELSRMEQDFRQYISDQVNREKGVYACCYCKNRESANRYESNCSLNECDGVSGWVWGVPKEEV